MNFITVKNKVFFQVFTLRDINKYIVPDIFSIAEIF